MKKFKLLPIDEYENYMKSNRLVGDNNQKNIVTSEKETQTDFVQFENFNKSENQSKNNQKSSSPPTSPPPAPPPGVPDLIFNPKRPIEKKDNEKAQ